MTEDSKDEVIVSADEVEIARLAKLNRLDYDRTRKDAANGLQITLSTLDQEVKQRRASENPANDGQGRRLELPEPELWPEPVDGPALLGEIACTIDRFLDLPRHACEALTLWAVYAHSFQSFFYSPRLALLSPEMRCGKTTALRVLQALTPKSLLAANISTAAVFRTIEVARPTLIIDEADTFLRDNEELRGIINSGHSKDGVTVRVCGEDNEPRQFSTWSPIAIAAIGKLPGTIADRSICIPMRRRKADVTVERLRLDKNNPFQNLNQKLARWCLDNGSTLSDRDNPAVPKQLGDRAADNWRPLLTIAELVGADWPSLAQEAAAALAVAGENDAESARIMLLSDIRELFYFREGDRLSSDDIVEHLVTLQDRPWPEWKSGKPISKPQLARQLSHFKINSGTVRFGSGRSTAKGYYRKDFEDAFDRYLPSQSVTPSQPSDTAGYSLNQSVTSNSVVTDWNPENSNKSAHCDGVTVSNGGIGPEESVDWEFEPE
jgi:hypothetical protein